MPEAERLPFTEQEIQDSELTKVTKWLATVESADGEVDFRTESFEDYRFYAGKQDDADVLTRLSAAKRPATVYNEVKPKVDMLIGSAAQSPFSPQLIPVGAEDEPMVELMQGAIGHYRRKIKLLDKELDCFEHTVKGGRSLLYYYIDRSNPFKPVIKSSRIHSGMFWIDPDSTEYDLSDARYIFIDKWLTEEEILNFWPNLPVEDIKSLSKSNTNLPVFYNVAMERYRIVECWYRKWVDTRWFINPMIGKPENLSKAEFKALQKAFDAGVPNPQDPEQIINPEISEFYDSRIQQIHYMIFSGLSIFESGISPYKMDLFPAVLYGAYKDEELNRWFSAITMMKDPQRAINTMSRQMNHLLQTLPKGILVHEVGAIVNIEEYEEKSAEPTYHLEVNPNKLDRVKFEKQPSISPAYQNFALLARQTMKDVSGISTEMMGVQTTSREPGITVRTRLEAGAVVLYLLFNNFRKSRIQGTKILMSLIQQYVKEPEVMRIQGQKGQQLLQINTQMNPELEGFNDISFGEFDVEFDEIMESGAMRAATALMLSDFARQSPGAIPPDVILEYTNIPFTTKQRIREAWDAQQKAQEENLDADRAVELAKAAGSLRVKEAELRGKKELEQIKGDIARENNKKKEKEAN